MLRGRGYWECANIPYLNGRCISIPFHDNWIFTIGSGFILAKGDNHRRECTSHGTKWRPIKWRQMCRCIGQHMWDDNPVILGQRWAYKPETCTFEDRHRYVTVVQFIIDSQYDRCVCWRDNKWEEMSLLCLVVPPSFGAVCISRNMMWITSLYQHCKSISRFLNTGYVRQNFSRDVIKEILEKVFSSRKSNWIYY